MFTRIVLPLDGSQVADHALGYATALADRFHASLTLVTVIALPHPRAFGGEIPSESSTAVRSAHATALARGEQEATDHLESIAAPLRARGIACEVALHHGNPAAEIIACAGDTPGTLIVMSTHGRTGVERWRLGSVAQHVLRHAAVPTVIVRARGDDPPAARPTVAEITVTLDGSLLAEGALPAATALADAFGVPLVLLTVLPDIVYLASHDDTEYTASTFQEERAAAEEVGQYLARVVARTTTATRSVTSVAWRGAANRREEDISGYLAERPGGIVVMASHGRGGVLRWVLGSTTEGMIGQSPQPVLIIRAGTAMAGAETR
jgi:nucleotide-binding universal stress UspA family protein